MRRKIEQHREVTVTDLGQPVYVLNSSPHLAKMKTAPRAYFVRLLKRQSKALSRKQTRKFWKEERS